MAKRVHASGFRKPETSRELPRGTLAVVTALMLTPFVVVFWLSAHQQHLYAQGHVLATRMVTDHVRDGRYGGRIYYRIEVQVRFTAEGKQQVLWLRTSEVTDDRESLLLMLARQPRDCTVDWVLGHLNNARCNLP
ncbi:MAG TPA: hypothetical protein VFU68_08970 [Terracidiphilus sp.]|nr:hypothetical protein [Terracidiphilus sp.]